MAHDTLPFAASESDWVPLRTLVFLRWLAVAGQLVALSFAGAALGINLPWGLAFVIVGAAVVVNLAAQGLLANRRLSEGEAVAMLLFDTAQLATLLAVTGGLSNPFGLLLLVPSAIAASSLATRSTVTLGLAAVAAASVLSVVSLPLVDQTGALIEAPWLLKVGNYLALVIGVVFLSTYARRVAKEIRTMSEALLATQLALAREQKLTDLAGVVAATAHEMGTPLATITLVSAELSKELTDPAQQEDARLIRQEADRCRDILRSMGRSGKDDLHLRAVPLGALLEEAAEPHLARGKRVSISLGGGSQPLVARRPEVIHALRNLVQNAVDFAASAVEVQAGWTETELTVSVSDDGPGYPAEMISKIGTPFLRRRPSDSALRPGYDGMGMGLFIAQTLLARSGATTRFDNGTGALPGACARVVWPRARLEAAQELGSNPTLTR